ncbi:MAG: (d)CMP kinase [Clostridiales bacterium]|nr:(d)CMP kinase [Clostridiales bacterium]
MEKFLKTADIEVKYFNEKRADGEKFCGQEIDSDKDKNGEKRAENGKFSSQEIGKNPSEKGEKRADGEKFCGQEIDRNKDKNGENLRGATDAEECGNNSGGPVQRVFCNKVDVTDFIREHSISKAASDISKHIPVRIRLSEIQREIAGKHDVVLDGRDAGTFVLPDANFKFFLTADVRERAGRRFAELAAKGENVTFDRVLEDIKTRDFNDSNRAFAPLKKAEDARLVDSTHMNADEVAEFIIECVTESV